MSAAASKRPTARQVSGIALGVVVAGAAVAALLLQRDGHLTGDDFALYINQARALTEGNVAKVISDNRFLWANSTAVTPQMYPWGFPILLAPFVRVWGIAAYDRMKIVEVVSLCVWLVLFHGIVRRRAGRIVALAVVAVFATSPVYLAHTDQLLTEFPHMMATALAIWWLDRVMARHRLTEATTRELVVLALLAVAAYNVRREGLALLAVIAAAQLVDVLADRRHEARVDGAGAWIRVLPWRTLATPYLAFGAAAFAFQTMLPSTLVPDNNNSLANIPTRLFNTDTATRGGRNYPYQLTSQLGLGAHPVAGLVLLALAGAGAVIACVWRPRFNLPLAALAAGTMLIVGTHFRMVGRYYFQITPIVVYFVTVVPTSYAEVLLGARRLTLRTRRVLRTALVAPALVVAGLHVWSLPSKVDAANRYNDSGAVQSGGLTPRTAPAFDAIRRYTDIDDKIVYYRVRSMNLYTERRGVQTQLISKAAALGDYFMQALWTNDYSQPKATEADLRARGWELVWQDPNWRLWRIVEPEPTAAPAATEPALLQDPATTTTTSTSTTTSTTLPTTTLPTTTTTTTAPAAAPFGPTG